MARDLRKVFREAFELPESERATLAGLLIESIEAPPDPDVEEQWAIEAERRWRQIEAGEVETIPWEEVRAKLFRPLGAWQHARAEEAPSTRFVMSS